ncbi:hypothetical protein [Salinispora cortesiana]|uniref:hypothetical protein n=1 Tax=Salinispora cortesiana TaxID=1305843 RepID=UPI00041F398E
MPEPTRLPVYGECRHDHHTITAPDDCQQALETLTDVWAALNRAGCHSPLATPAELVDRLAADRDQTRATLDDAVERIDRARARYATRPGSPAGGAQGAVSPTESHAQARVDPERDYDTTCPPIGMQAFLDYSTAEFTAARTADERIDAIRDLLEGWYDRWDAHYPGAVTDEHDGLARHLVTLITAAETRASKDTAGTLIRHCVYPGCPRTYHADVGPQDRGWIRLRGLTVLCPDHSTAAGSTQGAAKPAESHAQARVDPERDRDTTCPPIGMQASSPRPTPASPTPTAAADELPRLAATR